MKVLIVLAHPEPTSFNAHLASVARELFLQAGAEVEVSDLYAMGFDAAEGPRHFAARKDQARFDVQLEQRHGFEQGVLPPEVQGEIDKIMRAELVLFQFPLWWFGMPAILKGWMDRVFVYGGMYSSGRTYDRGVCLGKRALLCVTTGSSKEDCSPDGQEGDTRLALWPAYYSLRYLGFTVLEPYLVYGVRRAASGPEGEAVREGLRAAREQYLEFLRNLDRAPVMLFNADSDFDENGKLKPGAPVYGPFIRHLP